MSTPRPKSPPGSAASSDKAELFRQLPSVHDLVESITTDATEHGLYVKAAREAIDEMRAALTRGETPSQPIADVLSIRVRELIDQASRPPLMPVINATGIIIHTGLGRAPIANDAAEAALAAARQYAPVELDMATGRRGKRADIVRSLLCELTGAESATVVNNNAAALMITLAALAKDRGVVVSRGELIEIGGSFRLPDVMKAGGAILREVGTTNRTRLTDYENAIDDTTGLLMKVHTSNYRVEGFTQAVTIEELVTLGRHHELPVIDDIGSGALRDLGDYGLNTDEPSASASIAAGADLVLFSGDKLLGGPQAGIIIGRADLVARIDKHPMMRAMRVDKTTLAALGVTLQLHRDPVVCAAKLPVMTMLTTSLQTLRARGTAMQDALSDHDALESITVVDSSSYLGGGSAPTEAVPSVAVMLRTRGIALDDVAEALRRGPMPVVGRISDGAMWLDLRTVFAEQDETLIEMIRAALAG